MNENSDLAAYSRRVMESVRFSEIDQLGHVNSTAFATYFEIGTRVTSGGRSSFGLDQIIMQGGRVAAGAVSTMVVIDPATNRITPMSDEIPTLLAL